MLLQRIQVDTGNFTYIFYGSRQEYLRDVSEEIILEMVGLKFNSQINTSY